METLQHNPQTAALQLVQFQNGDNARRAVTFRLGVFLDHFPVSNLTSDCLRSYLIAELTISSVSRQEFGFFFLSSFQAFRCEDQAAHVEVSFQLADGSKIDTDQLDHAKELISRFQQIPNDIDPSEVDSRVLSFAPFLATLNNCSEYVESVILELRRNSVVVTDYIKHRRDAYFTKESEHSLMQSRISPIQFSVFLHDFDSLMIHSSCVSFNGKAAVFLAMDEGGKTTAASLCEGGRVLSDDQNLFRKQTDGSWLAFGTPWTTFPPDPGSTVPAAFFLLEKADEFSLQKLEPLKLFSFLWDEHSSSRFIVPKVYQTKLFDLYRSLSSSAPAYLMKFPRDYIDQEAILKCLNP